MLDFFRKPSHNCLYHKDGGLHAIVIKWPSTDLRMPLVVMLRPIVDFLLQEGEVKAIFTF